MYTHEAAAPLPGGSDQRSDSKSPTFFSTYRAANPHAVDTQNLGLHLESCCTISKVQIGYESLFERVVIRNGE